MDSKTTKKSIPKPLKNQVWEVYVGNDIARTKCLCCNHNEILMNNFHCAHVIAESKGGETNLKNLRPICATCNLSMKTENMFEYKKRCGFSDLKEFKSESKDYKSDSKYDYEEEIESSDEEIVTSKSNDTMTWYSGARHQHKPKYFKVPCEQLPVNGVTRDWPLLSSLREMRIELYGVYREIDAYIFERI